MRRPGGRHGRDGGPGGLTFGLVAAALTLVPLAAHAQGISDEARAKFHAAAESVRPPTLN